MAGVAFIFVAFSVLDRNWTNALFGKFKIFRYIRMHGRQGIYDKKKQGNLHKNSLFLIWYIMSNVIVMENHK